MSRFVFLFDSGGFVFVCLFVLSAGNLLESYIFFFGIAEIAVHSSILEV